MIDVCVNLSTNPYRTAPVALSPALFRSLSAALRPLQTAIMHRTRHLHILYRKHGAGCDRSSDRLFKPIRHLRTFRILGSTSDITILLNVCPLMQMPLKLKAL